MEDRIDVEKGYAKIKYKLPNFKDLDSEFEISFIKEEAFLLRNIRRKVTDKIILSCRIIESLIYPTQSNIITAIESKSLDDEQKNKMDYLYKKFMIFERESLRLDMNPSEKGDADYIIDVFNKWSKLKKEMKKIVLIMKDSWVKEEKSDKNNYFG